MTHNVLMGTLNNTTHSLSLHKAEVEFVVQVSLFMCFMVFNCFVIFVLMER